MKERNGLCHLTHNLISKSPLFLHIRVIFYHTGLKLIFGSYSLPSLLFLSNCNKALRGNGDKTTDKDLFQEPQSEALLFEAVLAVPESLKTTESIRSRYAENSTPSSMPPPFPFFPPLPPFFDIIRQNRKSNNTTARE